MEGFEDNIARNHLVCDRYIVIGLSGVTEVHWRDLSDSNRQKLQIRLLTLSFD